MDRIRLEKIEGIYQAVLDQPPETWSSFIQDSCEGDDELRREIESLLSYADRLSSFIDSPPAGLVAEVFASEVEERLPPGGRLGHYEIERMLGEGGMGEVYLAQDTRLHRRVALKVLPRSIVGDTGRLARFEREARAASALNHPNILTVHEFGEEGGVHYIATEFVDGLTLRSKMLERRLELGEVLDTAIQIASALSSAHAAGITHRDIKPENIMVRQDGYIKVLDFGLAKLAPETSSSTPGGSEDPTRALLRTEPGAVVGTDAYMSPEQARGRPIDARTDIWSLGVVLYEMLAGRRPFAGETRADVMVAVLSSEPPPLAAYAPDVPHELEWIVAKALSKDAEGRYQTAKELRVDLVKVKREHDLGISLSGTAGQHTDGGAGAGGTSVVSPDATGKTARATASYSFFSSKRPAAAGAETRSRWLRPLVASATLLAAAIGVVYFLIMPSLAGQKIDSVAVLPFENRTGSPDLTWVSDGLSESLIDRLAQLPQLKVIARNSSFRFRGPEQDLTDIASQLGVRAIVTGTVDRIGDDLSIRVDIVDAVDNRHLGGGVYRRKGTDLAGLQNEIARKAAEQFRLGLSEPQSQRLDEPATQNSEAFRYYLSGLVELNGPQDTRGPALAHFEQAVKLDPDFAAAYAEIAWVYLAKANASDDPHELLPKARVATERALELEPGLAKAHALRAMVKEYEFDWRGADEAYAHAVELSPNLDFARNNYAFFLSIVGRHDEALEQLAEQQRRDPINRRFGLLQKAIILVQARRFDDALQAYQEAQAVEPGRDVPAFALGYAYGGKGLNAEASDHYRRAVAILGGEQKYSQPLVYLAATYARMPDKREEARLILKRIEAMPNYVSPALLAIVYSALDDNDRAMALLEEAFVKRDLLLRFIATGYEYDGLRSDPRFADLVRRLGMTN